MSLATPAQGKANVKRVEEHGCAHTSAFTCNTLIALGTMMRRVHAMQAKGMLGGTDSQLLTHRFTATYPHA
eukprot:6186294-Pleurochrysis_carterae.AAC.3